ncbi:MAG: 16S rRNA (uracil(1498)-N(3))-methyltransferase [Deltaproteobacteria bacterium]|nr:16S rRNA (uracil(1498)-N(3))-methyltransferase [Deltaproteobacteria bacterium]
MSSSKNRSRVFVDLTPPDSTPPDSTPPDSNSLGATGLAAGTETVSLLEIQLADEDSHHLRDVLRARIGEELIAVDRASGTPHIAVITSLKPEVRLRIVKPLPTRSWASKVNILASALLKGDRSELVCEKSCELGVAKLIFWQPDHGVVKLSERNIDSKLRRMRSIVQSAARQSFNVFPPAISIVKSTDELMNAMTAESNSSDQTFFCSLSPDAETLKPTSYSTVNLVIGPEGDFSNTEEQSFRAARWKPLSLGPMILRAETAAIAAIAAANAVLGFREK